jgi:hypothetical protein
MKLPRRRFLHLAAGAAALPAISRIATAQAYPSRIVMRVFSSLLPMALTVAPRSSLTVSVPVCSPAMLHGKWMS